MRKILIFCLVVSVLALNLVHASALSNESIQAKKAIDKASSDIREMQLRDIPIARANESLQEALQLYAAQLALEDTGSSGNYKVVLNDAQKVSNIKEAAIKASDELRIFNVAYIEASKETNLSEMHQQYDEIQKSFNEERFEDTSDLINKGYKSISDIQASQTSLKLFYDTTSNTLKKFFTDNWIKILIIALAAIIALVIFWTTIKKLGVNSKIRHLMLEKDTLNSLIKKMQGDYFKSRTISETEYRVKTERFKEMIRDIDRQIPLLKEELVKLEKNNTKKKPK